MPDKISDMGVRQAYVWLPVWNAHQEYWEHKGDRIPSGVAEPVVVSMASLEAPVVMVGNDRVEVEGRVRGGEVGCPVPMSGSQRCPQRHAPPYRRVDGPRDLPRNRDAASTGRSPRGDSRKGG